MNPDTPTHKIASRLKELRLQKDFTQSALAHKAGINANTYAKIERGEQSATVAMLATIANALEVELEEIFKFRAKQ